MTENILAEGKHQRRRTRRHSPSRSSSRRASRRRRKKNAEDKTEDDGNTDSDGAGLSRRSSAAAGLSRRSSASFKSRASSAASSDAEGEYICVGDAYNQAAGESIVLEPEGLDATRLYEDSRPGRRQSHLTDRRMTALVHNARASGTLYSGLPATAEEGYVEAEGAEGEGNLYDDPYSMRGMYEDHNLPEFMLREQPDEAMYMTVEPSMKERARAVKARKHSKEEPTEE